VFDQLQQNHAELHVMAKNLFEQHKDGDIDIAQQGLIDLQTEFDKLRDAIMILLNISKNLKDL